MCGVAVESYQTKLFFNKAMHWCDSCALDYKKYIKIYPNDRYKSSFFCIKCGSKLAKNQQKYCSNCVPKRPVFYDGITNVKFSNPDGIPEHISKKTYYCNCCGTLIGEVQFASKYEKLCATCRLMTMDKVDFFNLQKRKFGTDSAKEFYNDELDQLNKQINNFCTKCGIELDKKEKIFTKHLNPKDEQGLSRICSACMLYEHITGMPAVEKYFAMYGNKSEMIKAQKRARTEANSMTIIQECPHINADRRLIPFDHENPMLAFLICTSCNIRLRNKVKKAVGMRQKEIKPRKGCAKRMCEKAVGMRQKETKPRRGCVRKRAKENDECTATYVAKDA